MRMRSALSAVCLLVLTTLAFATDIHEVPGGLAMVDLGFPIPAGWAMGDLLLCDPGATCAASYAGVDLSLPGADAGISDVLRFVDKDGEAFAYLYDEPYWKTQSSFPIYGFNDLAAFIAAGFARPGDDVTMGGNSGFTIPETPPVTGYLFDRIFSSETPEPSTVCLLAFGLAAIGRRIPAHGRRE